jgi:hypothetical protein
VGLFPRRLSQLNLNPVFLRLGEMDYGKRFFKEGYFANLILQKVLSIYPQRQD